MDIWWTADTHFSHENIIRYCDRPFRDAEEMNERLMERWNASVAPDDVVWHLGDLVLGAPIERQIAFTARLNGRRRLVPGNHDRVASFYEGGNQRSRYWAAYEIAGWAIMPEVLEHVIAGRRVLVCHFPYRGDAYGQDRYRANRPVDRGLPIIHGHVHTEFAEEGRQFNVGVDVRGFAPVNQAEIQAWLERIQPSGAH